MVDSNEIRGNAGFSTAIQMEGKRQGGIGLEVDKRNVTVVAPGYSTAKATPKYFFVEGQTRLWGTAISSVSISGLKKNVMCVHLEGLLADDHSKGSVKTTSISRV